MAKHTEGPWLLDGFNLSKVIRCVTPRGDPKARHICGDYEDIATCHEPNWKANAQLTASAPELLAACKTVLAHVEDMDAPRVGNQCTLCHTHRKILREAIAKAEGREE